MKRFLRDHLNEKVKDFVINLIQLIEYKLSRRILVCETIDKSKYVNNIYQDTLEKRK